MKYALGVVAAVVIVLLAPSLSQAQPSNAPSSVPAASPGPAPPVEPEKPRRTFRIEGQLGLGMPLGGAGIEASYLATSGLSLSVGFGTSIHNDPQYAIMPRLHLFAISSTAYLSVGAGLSYGDYEEIDLWGDDGDRYPGAVWGNFELSAAIYVGPIGLRVFSGFSRVLTHGDTTASSSGGIELPFLGFGLSASF